MILVKANPNRAIDHRSAAARNAATGISRATASWIADTWLADGNRRDGTRNERIATERVSSLFAMQTARRQGQKAICDSPGKSAMESATLVESIYEAAFVPERWPCVLDALCRICGSASSTLMLSDGICAPRWQTTPRTRELMEVLAQTDVWKRPERGPERLIESSVDDQYFHCVNDLMPRQQLDRDPVYQAFKAAGLEWQVGTAIPMPGAATIILTLEREAADGRHSAEQLARASGFRAHLARAGLIAGRLGMEHARGALDAMTAIGLPAALLDRRGAVLDVNKWMDDGMIDTRGGDRIVLGDAVGDPLLSAILCGESCIRSIPLPPRQGIPGRIVHVIPLVGAARDIFSGGLSLIVMNVSAGSYRQPDLTILRALFDLSPAESRLAGKLAIGESLASAAVHCHIQPSTARAYLEQIFHKTGCHRQAELVALLVGLVSVWPYLDPESCSPH